MGNKLYCGAGKENITPPAGLLLQLPGLMGKHFSGKIYDELYVRAAVFKNEEKTALFVEFDLDKAPNPAESLAAIRERFGLAQENVLFFGVHTHTAPISSLRPFEPMSSREFKSPKEQEAMLEYERILLEKTLLAVEKALNNLKEAKIGWATGMSYINSNRCQNFEVETEDGRIHSCCALGINPEGPVDHTLFVMKAENMQGEPIAFLINYPVHCCVMIGNDSDGKGNIGLSGDIAGVTSQLVEEKYGGICIWSSGAAGDVNPIFMNQYYYPDPKNGAVCEYHIQGAEAAKAALKVLTGRHFADIAAVLRRLKCETEEGEIKTAMGWSKTPGRRIVKKAEGWDAPVEILTGEGILPYSIRLHPVVIGEVAFCGISGEMYTRLGRTIQEASPAKHTCIINHDACLMENTGYIPDDETIERCAQNLPGHFLPGIRDSAILPGYVEQSLAALIKELMEEKK